MDLSLSFRAGRLTGSGVDPVGLFVLQGGYEGESREVWWVKSYPGSHDVFYKGCRDARGIWGTWEISSWFHGGFHIWPKGEGEGAVEHAEERVPVLR